MCYNKVLLARRSAVDINVLGKWEFHGGKAEQDENEFDRIERKIKEELLKYDLNQLKLYEN